MKKGEDFMKDRGSLLNELKEDIEELLKNIKLLNPSIELYPRFQVERKASADTIDAEIRAQFAKLSSKLKDASKGDPSVNIKVLREDVEMLLENDPEHKKLYQKVLTELDELVLNYKTPRQG